MEERLQKLRNILKEQKLDAVLLSSVLNIYYLTGYGGFSIEERDAYLFITQKSAYLFTNALYIDAVREQVHLFEIIEQNRDNPLHKILPKLAKKDAVTTCGFEDTNLNVHEFMPLSDLHIEFHSISLDELRTSKDAEEIKLMQKACALGDEAFEYIQTQIKEGITETELAHKLELFIKQQGNDISFRAIVAFGKNAAVPHHFLAETKLQKNSCVLLDFGVKYKKYCSDMTRTVFFGESSKEHEQIYNTVLQAQQKAIDLLKERLSKEVPEKIALKDIDIAAREYIIAAGFPSIPHTLGHGIGLEVHEGIRLYKTSEEYFANGMVFSIEPGIYLPKNNIGVRIEDLFAIQNNTLVQLTHSPREILKI